MNNFDFAFAYTFKNEGTVYTDNPDDAGGPTKFGITLRTYRSYYGKGEAADIQNLDIDTAKSLYRALYWEPLSLGKLESVFQCIALFDTSVLYGTRTAAVMAQKAINTFGYDLKLDGLLGDKSVELLNETRGPEFIKAYSTLVLQRIDEVILAFPKNEVFREGWTRRADRLLTLNEPDILMKLSQEGV
jgi:lysozyme family protein